MTSTAPFGGCEHDGLPPLWPQPPQWAFDDRVLFNCCMLLRVQPNQVRHLRNQRINDLSQHHMHHLVDQYSDAGNKTFEEWSNLILKESGKDHLIFRGDTTQGTAIEFCQEVTRRYRERLIPITLRPEYRPPTDLPIQCDRCKKITKSECGNCGESYCSRKCLKEDWADHKRVCQIVWEHGGSVSATITDTEMKETLSTKEYQRATGVPDKSICNYCHQTPSSGNRLLECGACRSVSYCTAKCQKKDWKFHKRYCKKQSARN